MQRLICLIVISGLAGCASAPPSPCFYSCERPRQEPPDWYAYMAPAHRAAMVATRQAALAGATIVWFPYASEGSGARWYTGPLLRGQPQFNLDRPSALYHPHNHLDLFHYFEWRHTQRQYNESRWESKVHNYAIPRPFAGE